MYNNGPWYAYGTHDLKDYCTECHWDTIVIWIELEVSVHKTIMFYLSLY